MCDKSKTSDKTLNKGQHIEMLPFVICFVIRYSWHLQCIISTCYLVVKRLVSGDSMLDEIQNPNPWPLVNSQQKKTPKDFLSHLQCPKACQNHLWMMEWVKGLRWREAAAQQRRYNLQKIYELNCYATSSMSLKSIKKTFLPWS